MTHLNATRTDAQIKPTDETVACQKLEFKFSPEVAVYKSCSTDTITVLKNLWEEAQAQLDTTRKTEADASYNRAMIRQVEKKERETMLKGANTEENWSFADTSVMADLSEAQALLDGSARVCGRKRFKTSTACHRS